MLNKLINRLRRHLKGLKDAPRQTATTKSGDLIPSDPSGPDNSRSRPATEAIPEQLRVPPAATKKRRQRQKKTPTSGPDFTSTLSAGNRDGRPHQPWQPEDFQVAPLLGKTRFHDLDLDPRLMRAIQNLGFDYCTPIQAKILPPTLAGQDALGKAQTGTGKSAAFLINTISRLLKDREMADKPLAHPRALILAPTRELASQIHQDAQDLARFTKLNCVAIFGGADYQKQQQIFEQEPVDLLIATPGRLLDFARRKVVKLSKVAVLVIDEADRLLDLGFIPDIRRIIQQTPDKDQRQTLLFSATLTSQIGSLAAQWTKNPITVEIEPEQVASERVEQLVYLVTANEKMTVLYNLVSSKSLERVLVFCNRRDITRRLRERLEKHGIACAMLSGEMSQPQRMKTLANFKAGKIRVLVATDVAGRGLHIEGISHVINYNLPEDAQDYVHRIGRTGRAGASGISVSFADEQESFYLPAIEEYLGRKLSCVYPDDELLSPLPPPSLSRRKTQPPSRGVEAGAKPAKDRPPAPRGKRRPVFTS